MVSSVGKGEGCNKGRANGSFGIILMGYFLFWVVVRGMFALELFGRMNIWKNEYINVL